MPVSAPFWAEAWKKLRTRALDTVIEAALYLRIWALVLLAHIARVVMAAAGVEPELVSFVAWMEKWVFIASFASFFWRLLVRIYNETRRGTL